MNTTPLYLDQATTRRCLSDQDIYDVVCQTIADLASDAVIKGPKSGFDYAHAGAHQHAGAVSGYVRRLNAAGSKWFVSASDNQASGLPRVPATIVVTDATTGLLNGVLDATELTARRTAAMAVAAAAQIHGRARLRKAAVIGPGAIGASMIRFLLATLSVEAIWVVATKIATAEAACDRLALSPHLRAKLQPTADARLAAERADLVFTATGLASDATLVEDAWLKDDAIVCAAGSYREIDVETIRSARIVVDDIDGVRVRGNLASAFRTHALAPSDVTAELSDVMSGRWTPSPAHGKTLIVLVGMGVLDVALGARALEVARRIHTGIALSADGDAE